VSPHFHNPANFQTLHNSAATWLVLLFSRRWQGIASDSLVHEARAPAIIHILADVVVEDIPQLGFTIYLLVLGLAFPCFLAHQGGGLPDGTCEEDRNLDDGRLCYTFQPDPRNQEDSSMDMFWIRASGRVELSCEGI
jgi:hypothetical protein